MLFLLLLSFPLFKSEFLIILSESILVELGMMGLFFFNLSPIPITLIPPIFNTYNIKNQ